MKRTKSTGTRIAAGATALLACGAPAFGQTVDALLDKLVSKGVLTVKEANDLKQESDNNFTTALSSKTGTPDWVTALKFNGDFRGRVEQFSADNAAFTDRTRYRYRARLGIVATLWDSFEVGLRLASADPVGDGTKGGNPISNNSTLQWNSSKKFLYIDQAYAKWTPIHNAEWLVSGTIGKMTNPYDLSWMVWDPDITPEGAALQVAFSPSSKHTLKLNSSVFVLGEINQPSSYYAPSHDPFVGGAQLVWEAKWSPKIETTVSLAAFDLSGTENLDNSLVPNVNVGNTRQLDGRLKYHYNPIVAGGSVTYKLASFPFYAGEFPIKVGGEYMDNPSAPSRNTGYWSGVTFGKSGKKKTWDLTYRYQWLGADAWYEEFVDDDNGAFYQALPASMKGGFIGASTVGGYYGGTNVKGHFIKANYSFTDYLTFSFSYYMNDLIDAAPVGSKSRANHLMADLMFKF
jgi:hypothetical protein